MVMFRKFCRKILQKKTFLKHPSVQQHFVSSRGISRFITQERRHLHQNKAAADEKKTDKILCSQILPHHCFHLSGLLLTSLLSQLLMATSNVWGVRVTTNKLNHFAQLRRVRQQWMSFWDIDRVFARYHNYWPLQEYLKRWSYQNVWCGVRG